LIRHGRLAHSHPATIYLFFHVYAFTLRLLAISMGAPTLFSTWGAIYRPITHSEIIRAAILGDIALIVMTGGWIKAAVDEAKREKLAQSKFNKPVGVVELAHLSLLYASMKISVDEAVEKIRSSSLYRNNLANLSLRHIWRVVVVVAPIGAVGFFTFGRLPGLDNDIGLGEWQTSSWLTITTAWLGLSILALIYWYGFKLWLMVPMSLYLLAISLQGYHRYRVIIPTILLIQIFIDRRQLKWPPAIMLSVLLVLGVIFYPLKTIGKMVQQGASTADIINSSAKITRDAVIGQNDDQTFLDLFASTLTLVDEAGRLYYGSTYLAILANPIPRQLWPEKPGLNDFVRDFSTPERPMYQTGMVVILLGELYLNFGYLGIFLAPFFLAYWLARMYFNAYRYSYFSVQRFFYLLIACNLIQVYRDGLMSIMVFTCVNMMPLMLIVALHLLFPVKRKPAVGRPLAVSSVGV
jgi:hypothetical protein